MRRHRADDRRRARGAGRPTAACSSSPGTNLSRDPSRSATLFAAERARAAGAEVVFDLDFRPDQWHDPRAFGVTVRSALRLVDIVIGTEDEIHAAVLTRRRPGSRSPFDLGHQSAGRCRAAVKVLPRLGPRALLREAWASRRPRASASAGRASRRSTPPVTRLKSTTSSGRATRSRPGFLYGHLQGWGWRKAARLGNACGAIVVTQHGCANFMPTLAEVMAFVEPRGGLD